MRRPLEFLSTVVVAALMLGSCGGAQPEPTSEAGATDGQVQSLGTQRDIIPLDEVKKSQHGTLTQTVANTEISIVYNRPVARGRELFGALLPYGEIWHPGADDASTIEFSRDVLIAGLPLPAGTYSLWTIPMPDEWTIIFSTAADVFHEPYPDGQDALRITVRPEMGTHMETMAFYFAVVEAKDAVLRLHWGDTFVAIPITVP